LGFGHYTSRPTPQDAARGILPANERLFN
jgi:hypothetical protein